MTPFRTVVLFALLAVSAVSRLAAQDLGFDAGVWDGKAAFEEDGAFRHCMVARTFPNGTTLFFAIDGRGVLSLAFHSRNLSLQPEREYQASLSVDERWSARVGGVALGETLIVMPLPNTEEMRGHLAGGHVLRFHSTEGATRDFPLKDTSKALPALMECAEEHTG